MTKAMRDQLHRLFVEKANYLQNEINREIASIGGELMLISRIDILHWVIYARSKVAVFNQICQKLKDETACIEMDEIKKILQEKLTSSDLWNLQNYLSRIENNGASNIRIVKNNNEDYLKAKILWLEQELISAQQELTFLRQ